MLLFSSPSHLAFTVESVFFSLTSQPWASLGELQGECSRLRVTQCFHCCHCLVGVASTCRFSPVGVITIWSWRDAIHSECIMEHNVKSQMLSTATPPSCLPFKDVFTIPHFLKQHNWYIFLYHKIYQLQVYDSMIFSNFTEQQNYHQKSILEFYGPQKVPHVHLHVLFPSSTSGNHWSTFCFYKFSLSGHFM